LGEATDVDANQVLPIKRPQVVGLAGNGPGQNGRIFYNYINRRGFNLDFAGRRLHFDRKGIKNGTENSDAFRRFTLQISFGFFHSNLIGDQLNAFFEAET
jgi:hypothetical protein